MRKREGKILSVRAVTRCNNCVEHILLFPFTWVLQDLFVFDPIYLWLETWSNTQINMSFASVVKPLCLDFRGYACCCIKKQPDLRLPHSCFIMVFRCKILNCNNIICRLKDAQGHWWVPINIMQILQSYCYDSRFLIFSSSILLLFLSFVMSLYLVILELRTACCKQDSNINCLGMATWWTCSVKSEFDQTAYRFMWWARTYQKQFEIFQNPHNHGLKCSNKVGNFYRRKNHIWYNMKRSLIHLIDISDQMFDPN